MTAQEVIKGAKQWAVVHGDCLDLLASLPDASVDVVVTDPPAGIGFMGKPWDSFRDYKPRTERGHEVLQGLDLLGGMPRWAAGFVAFMVEVWVEVDRALKPGGFVCAWALPKTADLAGLAMRLVGWSIHDSLLHLFGGGMKKGLDISKKLDEMAGAEREVLGTAADFAVDGATRNTDGSHARPGNGGTLGVIGDRWSQPITAPATEAAMRWDGWHTQLAPGHEQWLLARKPTPLTYADNVTTHGCGGLHVDACRIPRGDKAKFPEGVVSDSEKVFGGGEGMYGDRPRGGDCSPGGSWPRNVVITPGGEQCPVEGIDRQSGVQRDGTAVKRNLPPEGARQHVDVCARTQRGADVGFGAAGGASRYFTRFEDRVKYCPKAHDRTVPGLEGKANKHPTHKHLALMMWLCRLMGPTAAQTGAQAGVILDPFNGTGTTGVAAVLQGLRYIGLERNEEYVDWSVRKITEAENNPEHYAKQLKKWDKP